MGHSAVARSAQLVVVLMSLLASLCWANALAQAQAAPTSDDAASEGHAESQRQLTPETASRATLAANLAEHGRREGDPYALVSAARLFASLEGQFARREASTEPDAKHDDKYYDPVQLLEEAQDVATRTGKATERAIKPAIERVLEIAGDKSGWIYGWHRHYQCVSWDAWGNCTYWVWVAHCHAGIC